MNQNAPGALPEHNYADAPAPLDVKKAAWGAAGIAGGIALAAGLLALLRRWRKR
jgi:hypothetical protein